MKLLWKLNLDNEPRQMHSLFPPLIIEHVNTPTGVKQIAIEAGVSDNIYAIDVEKGEADLEEAFRQHLDSASQRRPRAATFSVPAASPPRPSSRPPDARQVHHLRRLMGRHAAPVERRRWRRRRAAREIHAAQRQAVRPESLEQRASTRIPRRAAAAIRTWSTRTTSTPTKSAPGDRPAAACGAAPAPRSAPTAPCTPAPATASGIPKTASTATASSACKQNPETKALELVDYYGPSNAEWLVKRDLDMQVTPAIFNYKGQELMVDAGKECRMYLMDTEVYRRRRPSHAALSQSSALQ